MRAQARTMMTRASSPCQVCSHTPRIQVPTVPADEKPTDDDFATIFPKGHCRSWRCVFPQSQARTEARMPKRARPHPFALPRDREQAALDAIHAASSGPMTRAGAQSSLHNSEASQGTARHTGECATPGETLQHACHDSADREAPVLADPARAAAGHGTPAAAAPAPTHRRIPWLRSMARRQT